jgi:GT2 family glycosyltransferase/SAM-dependent methyltransferase
MMMADAGLQIVHIDLANGLPERGWWSTAGDVRVVWWYGDLPLGQDDFNRHGLPPGPLADRVAHTAVGPVADRLGIAAEGSQDPPSHPLAELRPAVAEPIAPPALAICTRDRPTELERCLCSVQAAADRPSEIVVIDNGRHPDTRKVVSRFPSVRYLHVERPGLSRARNAAVAATSAEVIVFLDDDTVVHPRWLTRLIAPFADPAVQATTGLVLPAELDTEAQLVFETVLGGLSRGFRPRRFDRTFLSGRQAPRVWRTGVGANMAVRREALECVGGFDERLGAGAAGCSEDSELWYRLLAHGWACVYEPASVVFHYHRRDRHELAEQTRAYSRGHVAALFVQFARFRQANNLARAAVALPRSLLRRAILEGATRALVRTRLTPRVLPRPVGAETRGYIRGLTHLPFALAPPRPRHKAPLRAFLAQNPFPRPFTLGFFYREKMRAIHRVAPDLPFRGILEVGGGRSGLARMLYPQARVTNLDSDPTHGQSEMNRDPRVEFVVGDATALPFADSSFDAVTLLDVLEHIPDDDAAAAEALRVVRPGGWVLVSSPNLRWRSPYHAVMRPFCPTSEQMMERWQHVRVGYDADGLARLFGSPPLVSADFINPVTVIGHDLAFSALSDRTKRLALMAISPLTWGGYLLQRQDAVGTETAASWRKPPG